MKRKQFWVLNDLFGFKNNIADCANYLLKIREREHCSFYLEGFISCLYQKISDLEDKSQKVITHGCNCTLYSCVQCRGHLKKAGPHVNHSNHIKWKLRTHCARVKGNSFFAFLFFRLKQMPWTDQVTKITLHAPMFALPSNRSNMMLTNSLKISN